MRVLSLHDGHNASACLMENGQLEFAIQEERLTRIKNHSAFPRESLLTTLDYAQLDPREIEWLVFTSYHMPANKDRHELMNEYRHSSSASTRLKRIAKKTPLLTTHQRRRRKERVECATSLGFSREQIRFLDHHTAHAAAAYYGCPWWRNESVLVLTADSGGDGLCATVSLGQEGKLRRLAPRVRQFDLQNGHF